MNHEVESNDTPVQFCHLHQGGQFWDGGCNREYPEKTTDFEQENRQTIVQGLPQWDSNSLP